MFVLIYEHPIPESRVPKKKNRETLLFTKPEFMFRNFFSTPSAAFSPLVDILFSYRFLLFLLSALLFPPLS